MRVLNIADPEFTYDDDDPPPFHAGMFRLGKQLGATQTGMSVYELPPGQSVCPYHYEYGEEEWVLVLDGAADAAHAGGRARSSRRSTPRSSRSGPDGAHQIRNDTDETVRIADVVDGDHAERDRLSGQRQGRRVDRRRGRERDGPPLRATSSYYDGEAD